MARSNIAMSPGSGTYAMKIMCTTDTNWSLDGIGVCLKDADLGEEWCEGSKHFMWGDWNALGEFGGDEDENNPFHMKCEWIGDDLQQFVTFDTANTELEMIYDSNTGEMRFKINGEYLGSTVQNLNSVGDLYWCVGADPSWDCRHDVTIVDYK